MSNGDEKEGILLRKIELYHGTKFENAESILEQRTISHLDTKSHYEGSGLETTPGYVYLTNNLFFALYYGNKHAVFEDDSHFAIFKLTLELDKLELDEDELDIFRNGRGGYENITPLEGLELFQSIRFPNSIQFDEIQVEYVKLKSSHYGNEGINMTDEGKRNWSRELSNMLGHREVNPVNENKKYEEKVSKHRKNFDWETL